MIVQDRKNNQKFIRQLALHPNYRLRNLGKLFLRMQSDRGISRKQMQFIFSADFPWRLCDGITSAVVLSSSTTKDIKQDFLKYTDDISIGHPVIEAREIIVRLRKEIQAQSLK